MQMTLVSDGAELTVTGSGTVVPLFIERDGQKKIFAVGVIIALSHDTPGGKHYDYKGAVWVSGEDLRNPDGTLQTRSQVGTTLKARVIAFRDGKQAEWNSLDGATEEVLP